MIKTKHTSFMALSSGLEVLLILTFPTVVEDEPLALEPFFFGCSSSSSKRLNTTCWEAEDESSLLVKSFVNKLNSSPKGPAGAASSRPPVPSFTCNY